MKLPNGLAETYLRYLILLVIVLGIFGYLAGFKLPIISGRVVETQPKIVDVFVDILKVIIGYLLARGIRTATKIQV